MNLNNKLKNQIINMYYILIKFNNNIIYKQLILIKYNKDYNYKEIIQLNNYQILKKN